VQRRHGARSTALRHHIPGAFFTFAALRGDPKFKLDVIEAHARTHVAMDFTIGNAFADTNNHGTPPFGLLEIYSRIINEKSSHSQPEDASLSLEQA
jgi:hypothetical protein